MSREALVPGARFAFDDDGTITASARIPSERPVARFAFDGPATPWRAERADLLVRGDVTAEIRDDSVLVIRAARDVSVRVETLIRPEYDESVRGRRLVLDEHGGFGVFPTRPGERGTRAPGEYALRKDDELWISVCPSRAPSAQRLAEHVAHEGRPSPIPDGAYPGTEIIEDAARFCRVLVLHAYFWDSGPAKFDLRAGRYMLRRRPWTTARHVPSHPDLFARVKEDARRHGMKLVVYMSPRYSAAPSPADEMQRIVEVYGVDGLYLDGLSDDFRRDDAILRRAREILGPDRILYVNAANDPFGSPRVYCPFIDARCDYVLRGASGRGGLTLDRFLRYAVSGKNISNAVGMWCHYGSAGTLLPVERVPPPRDIDAALANGVRLWRRSVWGDGLREFDRRYFGGMRANGTA